VSEKKRVLFLINSLAGGGAERVMSTLLSASSDYRERYDIQIALLDVEAIAYDLPEWLKIHQLDSKKSTFVSILRFASVVRKFKPDITVSFLSRSNISAIIVGKIYGHKVIISERVNSSAHLGAGFRAIIAKTTIRFFYPLANSIIAPSSGVEDDLCTSFGINRTLISVVANPIDVAKIRHLSLQQNENTFPTSYIIAVGRLTTTKNFSNLIAAYAKARIDVALVILGQGPLEEALREQIATLNLSDRVLLAGFHENPFAVMRNALAYVSASRGEGFPNSLVEAMAVSLPVVSTNCPSGPSEILAGKSQDEITGIEYAPYGILTPVDDSDALATVLRALEDPELRRQYADAALSRALSYDVDSAARKFWNIIEQVVHRSTPQSVLHSNS
jgi:N-acetylgalactosamine-N,N'-diacetylbacillosaminyl-diphospho-undecaprenol 4-alpha-N-acetylgalactosaminyltransferase